MVLMILQNSKALRSGKSLTDETIAFWPPVSFSGTQNNKQDLLPNGRETCSMQENFF